MIQRVLRKMAARFYPRGRSSSLEDHEREGSVCSYITALSPLLHSIDFSPSSSATGSKLHLHFSLVLRTFGCLYPC